MERIRMKDLPEGERPYEKCLRCGPECLTDAELLAAIIRTGSRGESSLALSERLLALGRPGDGLVALLHHSLTDLTKIRGIGPVKGVQLACVGELSKRAWKRQALEERQTFHSPEEIAAYCMEDMRHLETEEVRALFLDTRQTLLKETVLSRGTVNASVLSPREVLIEALRCRAVSLVLVHNHPSGDPTPSRDDKLLTQRIREAANVIGIPLIDHIVIGDLRFFSFRQENLLIKS